MAKPFLETGEHGGFIARLNIDDAAGKQPGLSERRRKEILPGDAPEHLAFGARGNAGGKERRRGAIDRPVAAAGDLVQRAERQPASRQRLVD